MSSDVLLEVKNLVTAFETEAGAIHAVENVSFQLERSQTLGIVGESGCGKSVTSLSIMRLLPKPFGYVVSGEVLLEGRDLLKLTAEEMRHVRGNRISMIFQEPMTALNPLHRVGNQIGEALKLHQPDMEKKDVFSESVELLKKVGIPAPEQRIREYPHQLSGGMRQRVMIAIALACRPDILIADEPTTALDVTIQAQILELMLTLQQETGMAIILITHDLGVIAETCDEVVVMYAGKVAEKASVYDLFQFPKHPYTRGLLASIPSLSSVPKKELQTIEGTVPELTAFPAGCRFQNRCFYQRIRCSAVVPPLEAVNAKHWVSCFRWQEVEKEISADSH